MMFLNGFPVSTQNGPSPQQPEQQKRIEQQKPEQQEKEPIGSDAPTCFVSPGAPPPPPPPPPPPSAGPCPPAPPPPPSGGAVPPAPPPPPAGGSGKVGGQGGSTDLAAALAGAKLRKTVKDDGAAPASKPSSSSGGGGGGNLMGEMSAILARRRKAADKPVAAVKEPGNGELSPTVSKLPGSGETNMPKEKSVSTPRPKSLTATQNDPISSSIPSAPSNPTQGPGSRLKVATKNSDCAEGDGDIARIKQEIIEEVKKELQQMKEEIIKGKVSNYFKSEVIFHKSNKKQE
uniref:Ena/VASP-like protein n=1 Tax=Cyprinodon variegatus TaxID=28743 RepID=A0A3Q2FCH5_CYPVA